MNDLMTVYHQAVALWAALKPTNPRLSAPLLLQPPAHYQSSHRLMVVGQETFGWGEELDPKQSADTLVGQLRAGYDDFDLGVNWSGTPFWQAAIMLYNGLNPGGPPRGFLWSNLVRIDSDRRRPPPAIEEQFAQLRLLQAEVAAFAPNVVVFFTGPRYDDRLRSTYSGLELDSLGPRLFRVRHPLLPRDTYRTDHPKYLRISRNWGVLDLILKAVGR